MTEQQDVPVFAFKGCALAAIATGLRTQNLRVHLTGFHLGCIDDHFRGGLLHRAQSRIDLG